jgi:hypothetical protein
VLATLGREQAMRAVQYRTAGGQGGRERGQPSSPFCCELRLSWRTRTLKLLLTLKQLSRSLWRRHLTVSFVGRFLKSCSDSIKTARWLDLLVVVGQIFAQWLDLLVVVGQIFAQWLDLLVVVGQIFAA